MTKIVQATERGQITLPTKKTLKDEVEDSWQEYKHGKHVRSEDVMKAT